MTVIPSRLGKFCVIKLGQTVLVSPCDSRMKILEALSVGELTPQQISKETGLSYSCVMDHIDLLERLRIIRTTLRRERDEGRRRVYFSLSEDPLEGIEELFMTPPKDRRAQPAKESSVPATPTIEL
jgi:transcription initiation factor IIE alpha subunit